MMKCTFNFCFVHVLLDIITRERMAYVQRYAIVAEVHQEMVVFYIILYINETFFFKHQTF